MVENTGLFAIKQGMPILSKHGTVRRGLPASRVAMSSLSAKQLFLCDIDNQAEVDRHAT